MDLAYPIRRWIVASFAVLAVAVGAAAQSAADAGHGKALIVNEIQDAERSPLRGNVVPLAAGMVDQGAAPSSLQLDKMILLLKRSPEKQAALDRLLADQQNTKSPSYRKWLSPQSFGAQYGADPRDIAQLRAWLTQNGFQVDKVAQNNSFIVFSGTNGQLQQAFQTSLHVVKEAATGAKHYDARTEPTIPSALAPAVAGFARLSNIPFKPMHADYGLVHRSPQTGRWTADAKLTANGVGTAQPNLNIDFSSTFHAVGPYDFATIYNVKPLWDAGIDGSGQSLAVVAKSDIDLNDAANFRKSFNLPEGGSVEVVYAGPKPGFTNSEGEAALDVQWSGAIAPKAKVYVVTSDDTYTTDGLFLDFLYAIDNNLAPVLSVSWGACELAITAEGHAYINSLWEQAAAQGITVVVSSGDAGSAACDQNSSYSSYGMEVNGMASTHYDTAVGGTDLYGTYTDPVRYWAPSNDPQTLESALSYVSEVPWNDSCANPLVLAAFQQAGATDATTEALCNDSSLASKVLNTGGGGGGKSNCTAHNDSDPTSCSAGWSKPGWQSGVAGIPDDGARDVPDISFFSGDGRWKSFYVYCLSDASPTGTCNMTDPNDVQYMAAGGTSFAAPAFAGAIALLNQKTGTVQGLINPVLYKLATKQYSTSDGLSKCDGSAGADDSSCVFHDVTLGTIAMPCVSGSPDCVINDPANDYYGVQPGWSANAGYDLATGIGSANLANLINNWGSVANDFLGSVTKLTADQSSYVYGQTGGGTITVTAATGVTGQPSGDVSLVGDGYGNGPFTLIGDKVSYSVLGLAGGTHALTARYAGDGSFAASQSPAVTFVVNKADTTLTLTGSRSILKPGDRLTLSAQVTSDSQGNAQTGALVFSNKTTGQILGTVPVQPVDGASAATVQASLTVTGAQLTDGNNELVVNYAGDGNYNAAVPATITASYTAVFTLSSSSTALSVPADGSANVSLALASNAGTIPSIVTFSCPSNLPAGLSCAFSPAVLPAGAVSANTTLTIYSSSKLLTASANVKVSSNSMTPLGAPVVALGCVGAGMLLLRRRRVLVAMLLMVIAAGAGVTGCGGSGTNKVQQTQSYLATSSSSPAVGSPLTLNANVVSLNGLPVAAGSVTFYDGGVKIGSGALNMTGMATMSTSALTVGDHPLSAVYGGSTGYAVSSSATVHSDVTFSYNLAVTARDGQGNSSTVTIPVTVH